MKIKLTSDAGFTLIEMMITVAIVAILASIALPAYTESVAKARRADAQGALYGLASVMERFYTENNTYCGSDAGGAVGTCVQNDAPGFFASQVPVDGGTAYYDLTISAVAADTYTLTAAGTGTMASDKCGDFTLTNTNAQNVTNNTATSNVCWRK